MHDRSWRAEHSALPAQPTFDRRYRRSKFVDIKRGKHAYDSDSDLSNRKPADCVLRRTAPFHKTRQLPIETLVWQYSLIVPTQFESLRERLSLSFSLRSINRSSMDCNRFP